MSSQVAKIKPIDVIMRLDHIVGLKMSCLIYMSKTSKYDLNSFETSHNVMFRLNLFF